MSDYSVLLSDEARTFLDVADEKTERICTEKLAFLTENPMKDAVSATKRCFLSMANVIGFDSIFRGATPRYTPS